MACDGCVLRVITLPAVCTAAGVAVAGVCRVRRCFCSCCCWQHVFFLVLLPCHCSTNRKHCGVGIPSASSPLWPAAAAAAAALGLCTVFVDAAAGSPFPAIPLLSLVQSLLCFQTVTWTIRCPNPRHVCRWRRGLPPRTAAPAVWEQWRAHRDEPTAGALLTQAGVLAAAAVEDMQLWGT